MCGSFNRHFLNETVHLSGKTQTFKPLMKPNNNTVGISLFSITVWCIKIITVVLKSCLSTNNSAKNTLGGVYSNVCSLFNETKPEKINLLQKQLSWRKSLQYCSSSLLLLVSYVFFSGHIYFYQSLSNYR